MRQILLQINDDLYNNISDKHLFSGSIGAHTRHIIEFYQQFLFATDSKLINYEDRQRNISIESDIKYAQLLLDNLIITFGKLDINENEILNYLSNSLSYQTSIGRELSYLAEHTIHHFALIRLVAESKGFDFINFPDFGIARSTLSYRSIQRN